jgi:CRISPR-associated endonuclease Csn1
MTTTLRQTVLDIVFNQRPTFWRLRTLGTCRLISGAELCAKGSWIGQQYTMLCDLNSLRIAGVDGRELTPEERGNGLRHLQGVSKGSYGGLRKAMGLRAVKFNYEVSGGKKEFSGNATEAGLRRVFGAQWESHPCQEAIRRDVFERLWTVRYRKIGNVRVEIRPDAEIKAAREAFIEQARNDWGLTLERAIALADMPLPAGWLRHSTAAIERMLPHLMEGHVYSEAVNRAFPEQAAAKGTQLDKLPTRSERLPDWRNPTVTRALTELRKVVNNLLAVYGKPDLIRIELARDLKLPKKSKLRMIHERERLEKRHDEARKDLEEKKINTNRDNRMRWILWQECKETSAYTGDKIGFDALFRRGEFQIDHIHPKSRSLNNNFDNLTLCETEINKDKGNRTPYEYYRNRPEDWQRIMNTLQAIEFPENKLRRFMQQDVDALGSEELVERQLRDTSYIATEARAFLELLGVPVQPTSGRVTAQLRRMWGLETILSPDGGGKNRDDHRHHSVDSAAIAFASPAFIKRLSDYYAREQQAPPDKFPKPWRSFREDVENAVEKIVVSHRVQKKATGRLHEQTALGLSHQTVEKKGVVYYRFVKRKPVRELSESEIGDIVDWTIREILRKRIDAGVKPKAAVEGEVRLPSRDGGPGRLVKKIRVWVDRQMRAVFPTKAERRTYAELGPSLHHIAIFEKDGKAKGKVATIGAKQQRVRLGQEGQSADSKPGAEAVAGKFLMSLCPGDMLRHTRPDGTQEYWVVRKFAQNEQIFYKEHFRVGTPKPEVSFRPSRLLEATTTGKALEKVNVDPIGRVRKARD